MEDEPIVDIAKSCRLCLMNENDPDMLDIDQEILEMIQISCIKMFKSDYFPARICNNCHSILQFIIKFHKMCENSVIFLRETYLQADNVELVTKRDPDEDIDDTLSDMDNDNGEMIINDEFHEEVITEMPENDATEVHEEEVVHQEHLQIEEDIGNEEYIFEVNDVQNNHEQTDEKIAIDQMEYERLETIQDDEDSEEALWIEEACTQPKQEDDMTVYILDENNQFKQRNKNKIENSQTLLRSKNNHLLPSKQESSDLTKKTLTCEICGNVYRKASALESHRRRHANSKPFECEICTESFDYNFKLERHMRKHTGAKPFTCEYCDRRFVDRSTMSRHQKIHRNERPYSCTICAKSFTYYSVLKTHIMSHTGEKPYACAICDKSFHRASDLRNHLETLQHRKDPRIPELLQNIRRKDEVTLQDFT